MEQPKPLAQCWLCVSEHDRGKLQLAAQLATFCTKFNRPCKRVLPDTLKSCRLACTVQAWCIEKSGSSGMTLVFFAMVSEGYGMG